jgi:protein disulfide-isomerase
MKNSLLALFVIVWMAQISAHAEWTTDFSAAQIRAKAENKNILLFFTGSGWCPWCKKLKAEVFSTKEFLDYTTNKLVLVELDFPEKKEQTPKQNQKLADKFDIEVFPTVIILNPKGKKVGKLGYVEGGPKAFIAELEKRK